jgi:hypothetical protein
MLLWDNQGARGNEKYQKVKTLVTLLIKLLSLFLDSGSNFWKSLLQMLNF